MLLPEFDCIIEELVLTEVVRLDAEFLFKGDGERGVWFTQGEVTEPLFDVEMEGQAGWPKSPQVADRVGPILSYWWDEKIPLTLTCLTENIVFVDRELIVTLPRTYKRETANG
jgi:hypothetical protein